MANKYEKNASGKYECPECAKEFPNPQAVGAHRRYAHGVAAVRDKFVAPLAVRRKARKPVQRGRTEPVTLTDERLGLTAAILTLPEVRRASREHMVDVFEVILRSMSNGHA